MMSVFKIANVNHNAEYFQVEIKEFQLGCEQQRFWSECKSRSVPLLHQYGINMFPGKRHIRNLSHIVRKLAFFHMRKQRHRLAAW